MTTTILMLTANPTDTAYLRLAEEERKIREGLERSSARNGLKFVSRHASRAQDVRRAMLDCAPNIIHFSGHGSEEGIILEDEQGKTHTVPVDALARLFEVFGEEDVRCVVLNACYSEMQAKAIAQYIPYVVGMNKAIDDKAAIEFSVSFYDAIGAGRTIEFAYKLGCAAIQMAAIPEHTTPILERKETPTTLPTPFMRRSRSIAEDFSDNYKKKLDKILQDISTWESTYDWLIPNKTTLVDQAINIIRKERDDYYGRGVGTEEELSNFRDSVLNHFEWILICLEKGSVKIPVDPYIDKTTLIPDAYCTAFTLISDNIRIMKGDIAHKDEELLKMFLAKLSAHYC